ATFASLRVHNYRLYAAGGLISNSGTWMGRVAQDWLVLTELTDHSASALGIATGLQFAPLLLLAPWSGMIADRFPKRRILLTTQSTLLATALLLGALTVTGAVQLWHVYALALVQGLAQAVDNPARQTFVSEMVGPGLLANAVALNSASFHAGRMIGPGVAGLLIAAYGTGVAMLANAASFPLLIVALLVMRARELQPAPLARGRGQIREGLAYVRGRPDLQVVMVLVFVLGTFGLNFQITTALMATRAFGKGPTEFGLLGSVMAIGSLSAALLSARRARPRLRVLLLALAGFTVASGLAALAPTYEWFAVALVPCGLAALTAMTTANALVQLPVDPSVRGRVMALYMAIFMGGTPIGAPLIGRLGDWAGPRWTIGVGTIAVGLSVLVVGGWLVRRENGKVGTSTQPQQVAQEPR
ncbi:MAG: MFS transporter, partial [Candidatus Phosphoribacter baldrii]